MQNKSTTQPLFRQISILLIAFNTVESNVSALTTIDLLIEQG